MRPFKKYVTCIMKLFTAFNFVTTFPVSFSKLHQETIEWEGKRFFAYLAALAYHVISTEVENHIFKHNWIFRHFCIYKQPTLTKQWNFNVFVQWLCSYFRYTGRLFFGYAPFVPHRNTIRISWETKKERLSYRKTCIEEFVWGISLFWLHAFLSMSFCCFLLLLSPPSQVRHLRNGCYKDTHIAMSGILFVDIMSKRSKTWKSIIEYYKLFFNSPSVLLNFLTNWASNVA